MDHLGNTNAVVNSTADTLIQSTLYYASGVPMSQSWGRDHQPCLYNGKEFIEAHGLNTYDYGFRGYYATIGRFTSVDPLSEQTPWQSPYAYAGNRFVNAIDWMGLGGMTGFSNGNDPHYIVINSEGYMIGGVNDGDNTIYLDWDGVWEEKDGKNGLSPVGSYLWGHTHSWYMNNWRNAKAQGSNFRAPGIYYGQCSIAVNINIGAQTFIPTPLGDLGVNVLSYEVIKLAINGNGEFDFDYYGRNAEARMSTLQFSLVGVSTKYSIKHELHGDLRYVYNSNTSSISVGPLSIDVNGNFSISYSVGTFGVLTFTITGNIYYE